MTEAFTLQARRNSFVHAFRGIKTLLVEQHNARIHLLATALVIFAAYYLGVSAGDWIALLLAIALVWAAEAINSALEYLCDAAVPEHHDLVGKAKDVAAAGVLVCALVSVVIAALVFLPYF